MTIFNCCKCSCTITAIIASIIIGVITAFLQVTAVITATPVFLWVVFGIAVVYLGALIIAALTTGNTGSRCLCSALNALLTGILGTILFSVLLLAVGITATSILSAILVGVLLFFFSLIITASACFIKSLITCGES